MVNVYTVLSALHSYLPTGHPGLCGTTSPRFKPLSRILHFRLDVPHFLFFELSYFFFNYCVHILRREKETDRHDEAKL